MQLFSVCLVVGVLGGGRGGGGGEFFWSFLVGWLVLNMVTVENSLLNSV